MTAATQEITAEERVIHRAIHIGHGMVNILASTGCDAFTAAIAGSEIVGSALRGMAASDPDGARELANDLASRFLDVVNDIESVKPAKAGA